MTEKSYEAYMLGAATFDPSGLPKEYFTLADGDKNISWVQTIFQALGLRSLLTSSLKLDNFQHAIVRDRSFTAIIVKQPHSYLALLISSEGEFVKTDLINWARSLKVSDLNQNPRFRILN
jgi:hypothetical protein